MATPSPCGESPPGIFRSISSPPVPRDRSKECPSTSSSSPPVGMALLALLERPSGPLPHLFLLWTCASTSSSPPVGMALLALLERPSGPLPHLFLLWTCASTSSSPSVGMALLALLERPSGPPPHLFLLWECASTSSSWPSVGIALLALLEAPSGPPSHLFLFGVAPRRPLAGHRRCLQLLRSALRAHALVVLAVGHPALPPLPCRPLDRLICRSCEVSAS